MIGLYSPGLFALSKSNIGNAGTIVTPDSAFGSLVEVLWRKD
jgi:hypothetical protein